MRIHFSLMIAPADDDDMSAIITLARSVDAEHVPRVGDFISADGAAQIVDVEGVVWSDDLRSVSVSVVSKEPNGIGNPEATKEKLVAAGWAEFS
jgi:hypothetical protein